MIERQDELKPCAHCGEKPMFSECCDYIKVYCCCGIESESFYGWDDKVRKQKAIDCWNRRVAVEIPKFPTLEEIRKECINAQVCRAGLYIMVFITMLNSCVKG